MVLGIAIAILLLLCLSHFLRRRVRSQKVRLVGAVLHKCLGIGVLVLSVIHMNLTFSLFQQRPKSMFVLGGVMVICALMAFFSFLFRKRLQGRWIVLHQIVAVGMGIILAFHVAIGITSLIVYQSRISALTITDTDLSQIPDGDYIGEYDVQYIYGKVKVTVHAHKITDIQLLEHRTEFEKPAEAILPEIVEQQTLLVDTVSGATNSSKVLLKAIENA